TVLQQANGKEFEAYSLYDNGSPAGTVFSYQGAPSWVQIDVDPGHRAGLGSAELVTDDGTQIPLRWFQLDPRGASGGSIPVDPGDTHALEAAMQVKEGGADVEEIVAVTMGPESAVRALHKAVALGADRSVHLSDDALSGSDVCATGYALAQVLEAESPDLVLL